LNLKRKTQILAAWRVSNKKGAWRGNSLRVRFLYSEDCPSHDEALQRLRRSIDAEGVAADVEIIKVDTDEEAKRLKFIGSPTIIVNGRDIDQATNPYYAVTCRAYRLEDGRISPLPSETMIRRAIHEAKTKGT
jgi:hypothetical protein